MKRFIPLLFLAAPAFAQEIDPVQVLANEVTAESIARQHMFEALKVVVAKLREVEVQKETLVRWLQEAQAKEAK